MVARSMRPATCGSRRQRVGQRHALFIGQPARVIDDVMRLPAGRSRGASPIMTASATISPRLISRLSRHPVLVDDQAAKRELRLMQRARGQHEALRDRDPFGMPRAGGALEILHHRIQHQAGMLAHAPCTPPASIRTRSDCASAAWSRTRRAPSRRARRTSPNSVEAMIMMSSAILPSEPVTRARKLTTSARPSRATCQVETGTPRPSSSHSACLHLEALARRARPACRRRPRTGRPARAASTVRGARRGGRTSPARSRSCSRRSPAAPAADGCGPPSACRDTASTDRRGCRATTRYRPRRSPCRRGPAERRRCP